MELTLGDFPSSFVGSQQTSGISASQPQMSGYFPSEMPAKATGHDLTGTHSEDAPQEFGEDSKRMLATRNATVAKITAERDEGNIFFSLIFWGHSE